MVADSNAIFEHYTLDILHIGKQQNSQSRKKNWSLALESVWATIKFQAEFTATEFILGH